MNKYQKQMKALIQCMPDIIPYKERKNIAIEALKLLMNNNFKVITKRVHKYIYNLLEDKSIRHWSDRYPHEIIASAIVDKNNILYNWKVGNSSYEEYFIHEGYQVKLKIWCVNNNDERNQVFEDLSTQWFRNFKISENYKGMMPY